MHLSDLRLLTKAVPCLFCFVFILFYIYNVLQKTQKTISVYYKKIKKEKGKEIKFDLFFFGSFSFGFYFVIFNVKMKKGCKNEYITNTIFNVFYYFKKR